MLSLLTCKRNVIPGDPPLNLDACFPGCSLGLVALPPASTPIIFILVSFKNGKKWDGDFKDGNYISGKKQNI